MRIVVAALIVFLVSASYVMGTFVAPLRAELEPARALALAAGAIWVLVEAVVAYQRQQRLAAALQDEKSLIAEAQRQADEARGRADQAQRSLGEAQRALSEAQRTAREAAASAAKAGHDEALNLLSLLQQKGRFLDFIMDDITKYPDAQIGAAARVVHQGCSSVAREYFEIKPVHEGAEGGALTLGKDYDAHRYRLIGRVTGEPPFKGRLLHRGWLTTNVKLPERVDTLDSRDGRSIIAPAEVELS